MILEIVFKQGPTKARAYFVFFMIENDTWRLIRVFPIFQGLPEFTLVGDVSPTKWSSEAAIRHSLASSSKDIMLMGPLKREQAHRHASDYLRRDGTDKVSLTALLDLVRAMGYTP